MNTIGGKAQEEAQKCDTPAVSCGSWTTRRSDSFSYDSHNRLSAAIHPDSNRIDYAYDSRGNLTGVKDERHSASNTVYAYDPLNRLIQVTQKQTISPGADVVTLYGYDVANNLVSVTDPNGNVTTYAYDDFARMQRQTSAVSGVTTYSYDPAGNLTSSTDANTATTTRTYDAANRTLTSSAARTGFPTEAVTWTYDDATAGSYGKGRLASMTDPSGSTAYAYERRGLPRSESRTIQGDAYLLSYGFDANGNRSRMTYPSGRIVDYSFDFADRPLSAISGATTYVSSASYEPFGPQTTLQFGNGTSRTMTYDNRYRPTGNKLVQDSPLTTLADYVLTPDPLGNITAITDSTNAAYNRTFAYDDLNRLTTANSGASLWGTGSNGYAYDAMGNMTSLSLGASRTATFSYSGTTPKLVSVTENGTPRSVSYDAAGNEAAVGSATYAYSPRNLLASGDAPVYVYDGRGLRTVTNADTSAPTITSFNPTSGPVGTSVTITGTNFTGATSVKFNGTAAAFTVNSANQITATVPSGATTGTISVTTPGGTVTSAGSFTVTGPAPTITSFTPTSGPVGTSVTITGTNFTGATAVKFNGTAAAFTVSSATQITATVPSGATTGTISVTTPGGTATSAGSFTVTTSGAPTITSFTPTSGPVGTSVTITGTNFTGATSVKFNGTTASFTVNSATQITATVPSGATTGTISVTTPGGTVTSAGSFTVTTSGAPTITSFTPTSGPVGTSVTITGTNFTGATSVKFNGTTASFTVNSATQITATVPCGSGANQTGPISVTNPSGTGTSAATFTVPQPAPPTISSITPMSGPVGQNVEIDGCNFTGATSVTFNGLASTFHLDYDWRIIATVPSGATTGLIRVTTPNGTVTSATNFTVGPWITSFSPASGPVGTVVTIAGANFTGATTVKFKNKSASFTVNSSTQITATVPSGAKTGTISVTTSAGTGSSSSNFTVALLGPMDPNGVRYASRTSETQPVERIASLAFAKEGESGVGGRWSGLFLGNPIDLSFDGGGASSPAGWEKESSRDPGPVGSIRPAAVTALGRRYFFYTPEMSLMAETELTTSPGAPAVFYEYVWFNGQPVAQVDVGPLTHWTFTDHLGTPLIQTDAAAATYWRAEHEPYGKVFALRTADQHQPLRLPGQEAEQLNLGPNGATERSYNVFRWYRNGWGRYTQSDPLATRAPRLAHDESAGSGLRARVPRGARYQYALDNPLLFRDPLGLVEWACSYGYVTVNQPVGLGGGVLHVTCTSECACGQSVDVRLTAGLLGASAGLPFLPGGYSISTIKLSDGQACPDAANLAGPASLISLGISTPVGGASIGTHLSLGRASGSSFFSSSSGIDFGLDSYGGIGTINSSSSQRCCPRP